MFNFYIYLAVRPLLFTRALLGGVLWPTAKKMLAPLASQTASIKLSLTHLRLLSWLQGRCCLRLQALERALLLIEKPAKAYKGFL